MGREKEESVHKPKIHWAVITSILMAFVALGSLLLAGDFASKLRSERERMVLERRRMEAGRISDSKTHISHNSIDSVKRRLREIPGLDSIIITVTGENGHLWCSGEVISSMQRDSIGAVVRKIKGVRSVDIQGINVTHQYEVEKGDNLELIAQKIYGDPNQCHFIYDVNKKWVQHPDTIVHGTQLFIP
jgi:hypothetical protein